MTYIVHIIIVTRVMLRTHCVRMDWNRLFDLFEPFGYIDILGQAVISQFHTCATYAGLPSTKRNVYTGISSVEVPSYAPSDHN